MNELEEKQSVGNDFQQELVKQFLLENGIISHEQIQNALNLQKKYLQASQKKLAVYSYFIDQRKYSFKIKDYLTNKTINEIQFPIRKKFAPEYDKNEWYPVGNNIIRMFSDNECEDLGIVEWNENEDIGVTIAKDYSYLQFKSLDNSYYFPVISNFNYRYLPSENLNSLPLDMTVTLNRKEIYFVDRGSGTLYFFDTEENKLAGAIHLRPSGYKKTLNITSTPDGRKVFATDNESPAIYIIDPKNLKTKKQPLTYGQLSTIISDKKWLYMLVNKPNFPELVVLDPYSLLHKATIQLRGNLFSSVDDPYDLMAVSPSGKYLLVMTYTNYPALFTPMINIISLETYELEEQILLSEKPTYLSFAVNKPEEIVKSKAGIIDTLIELGYIDEEQVLVALDKINGVENTPTVSQYLSKNRPQEFGFIEEKEEEVLKLDDEEKTEQSYLSTEEKYPVLSNYEFDPSLLLAFKEEQMRYFCFIPVNKIDGKLTIACANPAHKETLQQAISQKFSDLDIVLIDFKMDEFLRFMQEFYSVIKSKYDSIISKQIDSQEAKKNENLPPNELNNQSNNQQAPNPDKKEASVSKELKQLSADKIKQLPPAIKPKTDLPPNLSANIPAEVRLAVREKLKTLDAGMIEEAIMAICLEDFQNIWGVEATRQDIEKHKHIIKKAKEEILDKDYAFIKIENFVGQFSLEIVVNQEKLVVMLKTLSDLAQKQQSGGGQETDKTKAAKKIMDGKSDLVPKPFEIPCQKCGMIIPPDIDICSKCARENAANALPDDIRAAASPSPLANLNEGFLLISDTTRNRVIELNETGQIVWQLGAGKEKESILSPSTAIRLVSSTTLVTDSEADRVLEFTKTGRIYWELKNRSGFRDLFLRRPVQAIRLLNGNTLIVDQGNHRVFEVNHLDKIVWQYGITSTVGCSDGKLYSPSYVQRLSNGHTLITDTDNHRVIEIDEEDKIVWQYGNAKNKLGSGYGDGADQLNSPMFATRLENNNTLIVDSSNFRVIEVNPQKQKVWSFYTSIEKGSPINFNPLKAYRVKNGNTLIFSADQIVELGPEGQLVTIKQLEFLPKSPNFKETAPPEETKVVDGIMDKNSDKAKLATNNYVKNMSNLTEIEVPLIDRMNHRIFIVNRYKTVTWRYGEEYEGSDAFLERPQYVDLIKDEHVLIADTDNHRVIKIYRPTKEIVWSYGITGAMGSGNNQLGHPKSAVMTDTNTVLITDQYSARVLEINEDKEIVWSFGGWETGKSLINGPYYAERIDNGNTLITDWSNHIVLEVNPDGDVVWQYGTVKSLGKGTNQLMYPEKAIRTFSGNTLIADTRNNRVIEVNDANRIVWEFINYRVGTTTKQLSSPTNVFRLENGHTVIVHNSNKHVLEISTNSEVVWQYQVPMSEGHHSSTRIKPRPD
ncbi:MAG: PQQ-binding-like beta-propeller repeat protein [Candidatus Sericytochromatia bacterium]